MPPNIDKKNYRLADMSKSPDKAEPYPDPDENAEIIEDSIDMARIGTIIHLGNRESPTTRQNSALGKVSSVDFENQLGLITSKKIAA